MIRNYFKEEWLPLIFDKSDGINPEEKFKISNYGRILRIRDDKETLFDPYTMHGYFYFKVKKVEKGKFKTYYVHKLVAQHFLEQDKGTSVIHKDYNKKNNKIENLQWVTKKGQLVHQHKNPNYKTPKGFTKAKLTENDVRRLKKMLNNPNRRTRLKIIARQFGVSEMQLQRIKTGENWGHIPSL